MCRMATESHIIRDEMKNVKSDCSAFWANRVESAQNHVRVTVTDATKSQDPTEWRVYLLSIGRRYQTTSMWLWMATPLPTSASYHLTSQALIFTENNWKYNKSLQCHVTRINLSLFENRTSQHGSPGRLRLHELRVYDKFSVKQLPSPPSHTRNTQRHVNAYSISSFRINSESFANVPWLVVATSHMQTLHQCLKDRMNEDEYVTIIIILINYNCSPNLSASQLAAHDWIISHSESSNNSP